MAVVVLVVVLAHMPLRSVAAENTALVVVQEHMLMVGRDRPALGMQELLEVMFLGTIQLQNMNFWANLVAEDSHPEVVHHSQLMVVLHIVWGRLLGQVEAWVLG